MSLRDRLAKHGLKMAEFAEICGRKESAIRSWGYNNKQYIDCLFASLKCDYIDEIVNNYFSIAQTLKKCGITIEQAEEIIGSSQWQLHHFHRTRDRRFVTRLIAGAGVLANAKNHASC